jgi:5-methylcytosine-specific restriction endonuclease McrA
VEFFPLIDDENPIPIQEIKKSYKSWLDAVISGDLENEGEVFQAVEKLLCLQPRNWEWISKFQTNELRCNVFGHICPVFFTAEGLTETRRGRSATRYIPRDVMLKVIRRDGQVCSKCRINVRDDEVEFDHLIPISRGGPTTPENLRVLCRQCNRAKGDALDDLLETF